MRFGFFHEVQKGGARRSVIEFGKYLTKHHEVDLYYVDSSRVKKEESFFSSARFYKFIPKAWSGGDIKTRLYKDTVELYKLYRLHKRIASDINKQNYDVVFVDPSQFTQAPFLLRFLKTKIIYYCQEPLRMVYDPLLNSFDNLKPSRKYYESFTRNFRKHIDSGNVAFADLIFANSEFSKRNIKKAYHKKSQVVYMGVDTDVFKPMLQKKDIDVLYVGAYDFVDGLGLFEKSLTKFRKKPSVKILAREKEWISSDSDLNSLYNSAKIVVCISSNEPFGLIPLEAMASGVPVIALNQGGYKESVVHNKTGLLIKNNPSDLASAIKKLLSNKAVYQKMAKQARKEMVENWDWSKRGEYFESLLKNAISNE